MKAVIVYRAGANGSHEVFALARLAWKFGSVTAFIFVAAHRRVLQSSHLCIEAKMQKFPLHHISHLPQSHSCF